LLKSQVQQQASAIATAISQLTGTDADSEAVASIGQAYGAFMGDAGSLQQQAEPQGTEVLRTAVGVYQQGRRARDEPCDVLGAPRR
jgi:hypothetical protein